MEYTSACGIKRSPSTSDVLLLIVHGDAHWFTKKNNTLYHYLRPGIIDLYDYCDTDSGSGDDSARHEGAVNTYVIKLTMLTDSTAVIPLLW